MHNTLDSAPSRHLRITNLHYEVTEAELKGLFQGIGPVDFGPSIEVRAIPSRLHLLTSLIRLSLTALVAPPGEPP